MTTSFFGYVAPVQARDERVFRSAFIRAAKAATPAIKEGCKVAFALVSFLMVMIVLASLDVWIWVPHFKS
jgi:hypothetical protein